MATTARNKVVRVEDYELKEASDDDMTKLLVPAGETDINERIIDQLPSRENTVSDASNNNALEVVPTSAMDVSEVSTDEEDDDELGQLPDGWPKIPQIFERKSWDFCSTVSPSVNKAASHLELLQGIIEEWFKETNSEYESRASSKRTVPSRPVTVHSQMPSVTGQDARASRDVKRLRFFSSPESHDESVDFLRSISSVHDHQQELSVHGVGAKAEPAALEYELPYLGADEVLDEVVTLLAKLENDRQETRDKLKRERERSRTLSQKIDQHCMRKLKEIPQAVQAEHEACANDISELNWHVTCEARNEEKIRKDCTAAESLNLKLKEDIEFIKGHIPLVAEKLELEKEAMARINQAQKDTDDELNLTKNRCAKVKAKSDDAHKKAEEERAAIKKDLDNVKDDLSRITEELSKAKMTYNYYIHQTNDYRTQIHDNAQELQVLAVKHENAKSAECIQDTKVKNVLAKVKQAEYEQRTLEEENEELDNDKEWKKRKQAEILEERRLTIENQKDRRKIIGRKNKELDIDLEDLQFKLKELDKHKVADEKNLERMIRELERTEQQYDTVLQELAQINLINVSTRQQLQEEEDRTLQAEEQLRSVADSLKRQVKEEIHSKAVLTAKITSDSGDTEQLEEESTIKKEKVTKMADEVEGAVKAVSKKVEKLRNAKKDRDKKIGELRRQVETFESLHTEMLETSEKEKSTLNPDHSTLSDKVAQLDKKIDKMNKQRDMMTKKIEEMTSAGGMMVKSISRTSDAIVTLEQNLEELNIQLKESQALDDDQLAQLDVVNARLANQKKHHRELMEARQEVLQGLQQQLDQNMDYNTKLASRYRKLTNDFLTVKNQQLDIFDKTVNNELSIKDAKQLQGLQMKMHAAMNTYFKHRNMYNQGELQRMQAESSKNGVKVGQLQDGMEKALSDITHFIEHSLDGDAVRKMAMNKVIAEEEQEKMEREEMERERSSESDE